jgi:hypothetical protein
MSVLVGHSLLETSIIMAHSDLLMVVRDDMRANSHVMHCWQHTRMQCRENRYSRNQTEHQRDKKPVYGSDANTSNVQVRSPFLS